MSTNNIIGRKITGFRFKSMGDILWHEAMEDYIGQIGKILFRHDAVNTVLVLFPDGRLCRYPLSLIEQHLVPESGGESVTGIASPVFDDELGGWSMEIGAFSIFSRDESVCQSRAQAFVNAEAYRVENERLTRRVDQLQNALELAIGVMTELQEAYPLNDAIKIYKADLQRARYPLSQNT